MFKTGFEKVAVSAAWVGKKIGGGVATRAGQAAGSGIHRAAGNVASRVVAGSDFAKASKTEIRNKLRSMNASTRGNPEKAKSLLKGLAQESKG